MEHANVTLLQELDVLNDNYTLKGTKVQATVQNKWVPKFANMLKEFECLFIQKPTLAQNRSKLKYAHYPNVIGYVVKCYNMEKCTNVQTGLESSVIVSNSYTVSRLFINHDIEDVISFKQSYLAKLSTETSSSYRSIGSSIVTSIEDEFLEKVEFSTIVDMSGIVEVKSLIVVGTVKGVCKDISWYYNACSNCSRKVKIDFNDAEDKKVVICNNSKCIDQLVTAVPRFKIPIRVQDYTGVVSLTLFDREALKLLHISAQDLLEMTLQDSTNDMIPQHFNGFMDIKYEFRIEVTKYNLENNIDFYSISKVTDAASIIFELEKKYPFSQDTDSFTGDNDTPISDSERLKGKKVIVDEHISSSLFANDNLKRNLDCVYDVDEATALSSTKQRISNKQEHAIGEGKAKLLIPKVEK
ncbi:hypothetical protein E3N88_10818 [Mikania micrantha]|uniref:Replication factor A C-terminal domain-containing protein n=1 Tax=Mikania micrantha TaxID=192012 RepID=A0A5N6PDY4_9ASTR|nr:hypothetical protein E3N88_10818 [Mikania micrantha]